MAGQDTHSQLIGYLLWICGFTGSHRFDMGKWLTGILYLLTAGLFLAGVLYDFWTLNSQVSEENRARGAR